MATTGKKKSSTSSKKGKGKKVGSHKKVRISCKLCTQKEHTKNQDRFHGMGSFKDTHKGFCSKKCCAAQNQPTCYREGQLKRKKKKQEKTKK